MTRQREQSAALLAVAASVAVLILAPSGASAQLSDVRLDEGTGVLGYLLSWLGMTVSVFLVAILLGWLVPRRGADALYETARAEPAKALGVGLLIAIALPIVAVAAMITFVGIPFGIALLLALVALSFVGFVACGWVLGRSVSERWPRARRWPPLGWLALGVGILCAVTLVPVVGTIVWLGASFLGIGAGVLAVYYDRRGVRPRARAVEAPRVPPPIYDGTEHPAGA